MVTPGPVSLGNEVNLKIFAQNIRGLGNKTDELVINWVQDPPHILCLSEHHLSTEVIQGIIVDNYNLGAYYCRKLTKYGGVCIFLHKSYQFINVDLNSHCREQDIEIYALRLVHSLLNFCVLSLYRSPTGNFDTFMEKLEGTLNLLFLNLVNLITCGDFNVNFMTDNTKKYQIISLLKMYNLDYIVNFPTRINDYTETTIDNIFLDRSKNENFIIEPYYNGLCDHNAQMLTLCIPSHTSFKPGLARTGRKYDDSLSDFKMKLSYENWENVFNSTSDNDVNVIFNNFLNTYLRIFYGSFPLYKFLVRNKCKGWLTKGILISCRHKKDLYLLCRMSNNIVLKNFYKKYCKILTSTIQLAKKLHYNELISKSENKTKTAWSIIKSLTNKRADSSEEPMLNIEGN